jgi:hypothetical protein
MNKEGRSLKQALPQKGYALQKANFSYINADWSEDTPLAYDGKSKPAMTAINAGVTDVSIPYPDYQDNFVEDMSPDPYKSDRIGKVTIAYDPAGAAGRTAKAPYKAGKYTIYVKATAGTYNAKTGWVKLGSYDIHPQAVTSFKVASGNNSLKLSWTDFSTSSNNVSYYRIYYKRSSSSKWSHKDVHSRTAHALTLHLSNKKTYDVTIRVFKSCLGSDLCSEEQDVIEAKTK